MLRRKFLQFFGLAPAVALTPKEWIDKEVETPKPPLQFKDGEVPGTKTDIYGKALFNTKYPFNSIGSGITWSKELVEDYTDIYRKEIENTVKKEFYA